MKSILQKYGRGLISKEVFVNFLADYNAFSDKATRRVLSTLLQLGYGRKILLLDQNNDRGKLEKIKSFACQIAEEGFQKAHVDYVLNCLCYALGWIDLTSDGLRIDNCKSNKNNPSLTVSEIAEILKSLNTSIQETYKLIASGNSDVHNIAIQRKLAESTIYGHISSLVEKDLVDAFDFIQNDVFEEIIEIYKRDQKAGIKPIYEYFHGKYNYGILRLAISCYKTDIKLGKGKNSQDKSTNDIYRRKDEANNLKNVNESTRETFRYIKNGCVDIQEIARIRNLTSGTICGHLASLIENNLVEICHYLSDDNYDVIIKAYNKTDGSSTSEVYKLLQGSFSYDDIKLALAEYKRRSSSSLADNGQLVFVDNISKLRVSKQFFQEKCRIVLSNDGYYLSLLGKYLKIYNILYSDILRSGSIWLTLSRNHTGGYRVVHDYTTKKITIGEIWRTTDYIMFEPSDKSKIIKIRIKS